MVGALIPQLTLITDALTPGLFYRYDVLEVSDFEPYTLNGIYGAPVEPIVGPNATNHFEYTGGYADLKGVDDAPVLPFDFPAISSQPNVEHESPTPLAAIWQTDRRLLSVFFDRNLGSTYFAGSPHLTAAVPQPNSGYLLTVATDPDCLVPVPPYAGLDIGAVRTVAVVGLDPDTDYYYRLAAYNPHGTGPWSEIHSLHTLP